MLSVSPNCINRSSLEEMLESLRQRDESEKSKDVPPALPARPKPTSRARLPSVKRPLPTSFEVGESESTQSSLTCDAKKGDGKEKRGSGFGAKKVKEMEAGESPYVVEALCKEYEQRSEEKDANIGYFIKKKLRVWCRVHNGFWESGQIKSTSGDNALVLLSGGSVVQVPTQDLLPANSDILEGVDNLVQLSYLNEPSVLQNLQYRYLQDKIYSKAGPLLVVVNPFKDLQLYGNDFVTAYRQKLLDSPHIYGVADTAYNAMMKDKTNQSIIISGESGSGKTETAKIAMQYLAAFGEGSGGIESEVLQTSCILEAFGNAKTVGNDNSSRFGKLIDIHFSATGQICGANIQTFLLEKSRVVQLAQGERSYHIFYQLCSGVPDDLRGRLKIKRASDYNYLNQSDVLEINNIDDARKFNILTEALNTIKICKEDQEHVFEMIAAVLWLGNVSFLVTDIHNHIEVVADEAVTSASSLIGCSEQDLMLALSTRKVPAGKDEVTKRLTQKQAIDRRDAFAKVIYASLFDWLVEKINSSLAMHKHNTGQSISILDICGFESSKKNGFEQLCKNYANERLQQHFNRHLFKLEQEEYESDGIEWTKVDFKDNQDCLELFEKKPLGLMSLLDEVSNFPKATDLTFATKLKQHLNGNCCFKGEKGGTFSLHHYAGEVLYDAGEFLEKNRDPLHSEIIRLLSSCRGQLPQYFASVLLKEHQKPVSTLMQPGRMACQTENVATKFKGHLFKLMQHLESTTPHFIHCVKPNIKQIPGVFEKDLALEQLRCCGVLEVAKMSRSGYPCRMSHQEFTRRYGFLLPESMACLDPLSMSIAILQQFDIRPEMYQVGYTKLYLRAGQIEALENVRKQVLQGNREVQKCFSAHRARQDFHELKGVVTTLQSYIRGEIARKKYSVLLGLEEQVAQDKELMAVLRIQSVIRGWLARKHTSHLRIAEQSIVSPLEPGRRVSEVKDLPRQMLPSAVDELQKRVLMAEATLEHKEKENAALRDQVEQFEAQWSEHEARTKSMEEMWQKQMTSLQMSLAAAKRSIRPDGVQSPHFYDSEDTSMGTQTPGGSTPARFMNNGGDDMSINGGSNPVDSLVKEFEQRKQKFDDEAQAIIEVKSGHVLNPVDELRRVKSRFEAWKRDYKVRLREAKSKVQKMVQNEHKRSWWGKRSKRL